MALAVGTNCGFVSSRPTADPAGTNDSISGYMAAYKFTSPAGANLLKEIGWYCDNATQAANYQVAIYAHDAENDLPGARLASSGDVAKGTGAGWKYAAVSYSLSPSTVYWLAIQLDTTATGTNQNYASGLSIRESYDEGTELPDPWASDIIEADFCGAIYGLYESAASGQPLAKRLGGIPHNAIRRLGVW